MTLPLVIAAALAQGAEAPNPYQLPIGRSGTIAVAENQMVDTRSGRTATQADFARAARDYNFVFLGETHDNPHHHKMQADLIEALVADGRTVIVGFEMFTRPAQLNLNAWTLGKWSEEEFIAKSEWKTQWGFNYDLYRPIFETVRKNRLPMLALNVPRDWVRTVSRQGPDSLPPEAKGVPLDFDQKNHKAVFSALVGGHGEMPGSTTNIYRGQVMWDEGMAQTALQYVEGRYGSVKNMPKSAVVAIVAGIGHGMYGQGINLRLKMRAGVDCLDMNPVEGASVVSRGLGDFVYASPAMKRGTPGGK